MGLCPLSVVRSCRDSSVPNTHMLLQNISRKTYMGSPFDPSDLTRSMSRSRIFQRLISRKRADLGHV